MRACNGSFDSAFEDLTAASSYCPSLLLWPPCVADADIIFFTSGFFFFFFFFFMVALWNRADHYIFILWFLSSFYLSIYLSIYLFSSPNLSGRTLDVYHISTHDVALVRI